VNRTATATLERERQNRRGFDRVELALPGRYMLRDRCEYPCWTIDVSPGGVALHGIVRGEIGERVVAYIRDLGWIEGMVARHFDRSFALNLQAPTAKRERLANNIAKLTTRSQAGAADMRRYERIVADHQSVTLRTAEGGEFYGRLIDVSFPGAAFSVDAAPPIGAPVTVGQNAARVIRHFDGGIAVAFDNHLSGDLLEEIANSRATQPRD
jgi:hypothetical protein